MPGLCCNHHSLSAWGRFCAAGQRLLWTFVLFVPPDIPELPHAVLAVFLPFSNGQHLKSQRICSTFGKKPLVVLWPFNGFSTEEKNNHCNITRRRYNAGLQHLSPTHHIYHPCCALCIIWHAFSLLRVGNCIVTILSFRESFGLAGKMQLYCS